MRSIIFVGLLWVFTGFVGVMAKNLQVPIIRINADKLTPLQIGFEMGQQSKALFHDIERRYDSHLANILTQSKFQEILKNQLPKLLENIDPLYLGEMRGLEGAWSFARNSEPGDGRLSLEEFYILNLLPDIGLAPSGVSFGVFSHAAADKTSIVGRNLDWRNSEALRGLQAITVYQYKEHSIVNIGFVGMVSVLSGFNSQGLFVSSSSAAKQSPYYSKKKSSHEDASSIGFDLRNVLFNRESTGKAKRHLTGKHYSHALNILIADKDDVEVLESSPDDDIKVRYWDSDTHLSRQWGKRNQIAAVNCFVLRSMQNNCQDPKNVIRWKRLRTLATFASEDKASSDDVANIMFDRNNERYEIFNKNTLQSLVYRSASNSLYLYSATNSPQSDESPEHEVYLDLLPRSHASAQADHIHLKSYVWVLLVAMVAAVLWVFNKQDKL
jgi:hypothetical protein